MPLNSLYRTRTLPDDADGLRANRNPLIEQASTLRKSCFYTNLPYGPSMFAFIGVLITVELQRRQLELQRHQLTLDELMRLSRDLAAAIDEILNRPIESVRSTQAQLVAQNKSHVVGSVLELVDLEVLPVTVRAMAPAGGGYEGVSKLIGQQC
jgi:hypothetical protein